MTALMLFSDAAEIPSAGELLDAILGASPREAASGEVRVNRLLAVEPVKADHIVEVPFPTGGSRADGLNSIEPQLGQDSQEQTTATVASKRAR